MLVCQLRKEKYRTRLGKNLPIAERIFYKYLGNFESNVFATDKMTSAVQEFSKRCRVVLQTELNSGSKMKGIRMFAAPVIRYSVALLNWSMTELNHIDTHFKKLLAMHGVNYIKTSCISHKAVVGEAFFH